MRKLRIIVTSFVILTLYFGTTTCCAQHDFFESEGIALVAAYAHPIHEMIPQLSKVEYGQDVVFLSIRFKGTMVDFTSQYELKLARAGLPKSLRVLTEGCILPSFTTCNFAKQAVADFMEQDSIRQNRNLFINQVIDKYDCSDYCLVHLWIQLFEFRKEHQH